MEETVRGLRKELEQCLISNKGKREQVQSLENELTSVKSQLKEQQTKAHRMEMIAQEHEVCDAPCISLVLRITTS